MRIGLIGGTFNPIHIAHLCLANEALETLNLDEVWFIPTGISYMKANTEIASGTDRLRMVELAISGNSKMKCLDIEIKRDGYTYTYETLEELHRKYPDYEFYFIFGADCLFAIETWKNPERIFELCTIIAATRNGSPMDSMQEKAEELKNKYSAKINVIVFRNLEISSTDIREKIEKNQSVQYLIPDAVKNYIEEKQLYHFGESD